MTARARASRATHDPDAATAPAELAAELALRAGDQSGPRPQRPSGDSSSLLPILYDELRTLAQQRLRHESPGMTLQATALVHEAYLRLMQHPEVHWDSRGHFFASAAEAMRRILIDRARSRRALRHGGGRQRIDLSDVDLADPAAPVDDATLLELDVALDRLAAEDADLATLVQLRFFAGLSGDQVADLMGVSSRTVKRRWAFARAWLTDEMQRSPGDSPATPPGTSEQMP